MVWYISEFYHSNKFLPRLYGADRQRYPSTATTAWSFYDEDYGTKIYAFEVERTQTDFVFEMLEKSIGKPSKQPTTILQSLCLLGKNSLFALRFVSFPLVNLFRRSLHKYKYSFNNIMLIRYNRNNNVELNKYYPAIRRCSDNNYKQVS